MSRRARVDKERAKEGKGREGQGWTRRAREGQGWEGQGEQRLDKEGQIPPQIAYNSYKANCARRHIKSPWPYGDHRPEGTVYMPAINMQSYTRQCGLAYTVQ